MRGHSLHGNREAPWTPKHTGRLGKADGRNPNAYVRGESDGSIVPRKLPNKGQADGPAEVVEGREPVKGNVSTPAAPRTQSRTNGASIRLRGVREAALMSTSTLETQDRSRMR